MFSDRTVRIFFLLGQTNARGVGSIQHLRQLINTTADFDFLDDGTGGFVNRQDVRITAVERLGQSSDLVVGYVIPGHRFFGPAIGFGWTVGDYFDQPILIIRCTLETGRLGIEWQSPSAAAIGKNYTSEGVDASPKDYGVMWNQMLAMFEDVKENLDGYFPVFGGNTEFEVGGILWLQGWNDAFVPALRSDYEQNLGLFAQDLMTEFGDNVPILIGELGQDGPRTQSDNIIEIRQSQEAVAESLGQNVAFVSTKEFTVSNGERFAGMHYYYGKCLFCQLKAHLG